MEKIVCIKIKEWGSNRLHCVKAIKELLPNLSLKQAKDTVWEHELPFDIQVFEDDKLKEFTDYTQRECPDMRYTIERVNRDEDYSDETLLAISKMEEGQKCVGEAKQMLLSQIRFLNTSLKGVVSHKEELVEKNNMLEAKVKDLTRQNETLTDHLKLAREGKKVLMNKLQDFQTAYRELNEFIEKQAEFINAVENFSQQINKLNSKSIKDGSTN